jgi:hypothetical protein
MPETVIVRHRQLPHPPDPLLVSVYLPRYSSTIAISGSVVIYWKPGINGSICNEERACVGAAFSRDNASWGHQSHHKR